MLHMQKMAHGSWLLNLALLLCGAVDLWIFEQQLNARSSFAALGLGPISLCLAQRQEGDWQVFVFLRGSSSPLLLPFSSHT